MDGHELRAVGKRPFDLNLGDHRGDAVHDGVGRQDRRAEAHDLGHRAAIANQLEDFRRDERDGFGVIQLQPASAALSGQFSGGVDEQFVDFSRGEVHA